MEFFNNYKCSNNDNKYKKYLYIPPISLSYDDILKIYDIYDEESLYEWLNQNIKNNKPINTLDRILISWIKINFNNIKSYFNLLVKIIYLLYKLKIKILYTDIKDILLIKNELTKDELLYVVNIWYKNNQNFVSLDDGFIFSISELINNYKKKI